MQDLYWWSLLNHGKIYSLLRTDELDPDARVDEKYHTT